MLPLLPALWPLPTRFLQFAVPRRVDLLLAPREHIGRRDKTDRAVELPVDRGSAN